jgi:hypothetical protein
MWHAWKTIETCARFWLESPKGRYHSEDQGVGGGWDQNGCQGDWLRVEWIQLAKHRDRWRDVVNAAMNLCVLAPRC